MKKTASLVALSMFGFVAAASAQAPAGLIEIESDSQMVSEFNLTVEQLEDMNILDAAGETIGEVEEVLGTDDGTPTAFSAEVGGFLGVGDTDVVIPFDQVTLNDDNLQVDMTQEQVEALDRWED
jgi:sporulation protein YlmC with PRC-barrel domain